MLIPRIRSFTERVLWLSRLCGDPVRAIRAILRGRAAPDAVQQLVCGGQPINYRRKDEQALKEVLAEAEYRFAGDVVRGAAEPVVLDVGAHIGTFAIWVLGQNPHARILSVEADPATFDILQANAAPRAQAGASWRVLNRAASDRDSATVFIAQHANASMSQRVDAQDGVPVSTVSLRALLEQVGSDGRAVDLAKVDIEGSEEAFLSAQSDQLRLVRNLVVELHPAQCDTERVLRDLAAIYSEISEISGRQSTKPLLWCRQSQEIAAQ